jgi:hypothetical protein
MPPSSTCTHSTGTHGTTACVPGRMFGVRSIDLDSACHHLAPAHTAQAHMAQQLAFLDACLAYEVWTWIVHATIQHLHTQHLHTWHNSSRSWTHVWRRSDGPRYFMLPPSTCTHSTGTHGTTARVPGRMFGAEAMDPDIACCLPAPAHTTKARVS